MARVSSALDALFAWFAKMRALRPGGMGPVFIRACVDLRWVRTGPVVCDAGGGLEAGMMGGLETKGSVASAGVIGLRV